MRGDTPTRPRTDRQRAITLSAELNPGYSMGDAIDFLTAQVAKQPPTAVVVWGGASKDYLEGQSGIVFAFGGFMIFHRGHLTMHQAGAWLPWVLWAFERFRRGGGLSWVVVAGTCMAGERGFPVTCPPRRTTRASP